MNRLFGRRQEPNYWLQAAWILAILTFDFGVYPEKYPDP